MILEVNPESLRDIAAAVHAAIKREPEAVELVEVEKLVLSGIRSGERYLQLESAQASVLRDALLKRAWDQRNTGEGFDYADLAERIEGALDDQSLPADEVQTPQDDTQ